MTDSDCYRLHRSPTCQGFVIKALNPGEDITAVLTVAWRTFVATAVHVHLGQDSPAQTVDLGQTAREITASLLMLAHVAADTWREVHRIRADTALDANFRTVHSRTQALH